MTHSALGTLPALGCGWVLRQGSEDEIQARLNPRWHCLSLLGMLLLGCRSRAKEHAHHTHRLCTTGRHWHLSTCRAAVAPCSCPGQGDRAAAPVQGHHVPGTPQSCQHPLYARGRDRGRALLSPPEPSGDICSWRAAWYPPLGQISKERLCSRESMNKLPNYFLYNPLQKKKIPSQNIRTLILQIPQHCSVLYSRRCRSYFILNIFYSNACQNYRI